MLIPAIISFRVFQIAIIVMSPIIGARQQSFGRKNVIIVGYVSAVIGCAAFGMLSHIDNR